MAVSIATLTKGSGNTDGASFDTASITPSANKLIFACFVTRSGISTNPPDPTLSGCGLTWELVRTVLIDDNSTSRRKLAIFRSMGASPSTGALTVTWGTQTQTSCQWIVHEFSGMDTSGTNGSGAVVQSASNAVMSPETTSVTATLGAFGSTNNATFGVLGIGNGNTPPTQTVSAGSGFTLQESQWDTGESSNQIHTEFRNDNDTTVDFTFNSDLELGCIGVEIKAAVATVSNTRIGTLNLMGVGN